MTQAKQYIVFSRRWWKDNPDYPNGLEPHSTARRTFIGYAEWEDEAREMCENWNKEFNERHRSNKYSVKAEYTQTFNLRGVQMRGLSGRRRL